MSKQQIYDPRLNFRDQFFYAARVTGLSSAAPNGNSIINIDADANFFLTALTYQADIAVATLTEATNVIPLVNVLITDTGSGRSLSNIAVPISTIAGDGKNPYRLPYPRKFASNATIQIAYTAYVAAGTTYAITLTLHGYKEYIRG